MSQANKAAPDEPMRAEYDIRGGVRGKYYERYRQGTNVVVLEPDVAAVFRDAESVNRALRMLIQVARKQVDEATSPTGAASNTYQASGVKRADGCIARRRGGRPRNKR